MKTATDYLYDWAKGEEWKIYLVNSAIENKSVDSVNNELMDKVTNKSNLKLITNPILESKKDSLYIKRFKHPTNINALSSDAECELGKNINVFFGENGCGKSSYVKVFRKLAKNYITSEKELKIRPNIYKLNDELAQTLTISYVCDQNEVDDQCINVNIYNSDLSNINVFDSYSVIPLINNDLSFTVLPQGFDLFRKVAEYIDSIKVKFQKLIDILLEKRNTIFADSSFDLIRDEIKVLTLKDEDNYLSLIETVYRKTDDFEDSLVNKNIRIQEIVNSNTVSLQKILYSQKAKLNSLISSFTSLSSSLSNENIQSINVLIDRYEELKIQEKEENEKLSNSIKTTINGEWKNFINAAHEYYKSIGIDKINQQRVCIFCGQQLEDKEYEHIEMIFSHIRSETNIALKKTEYDIQNQNIANNKVIFTESDEQLFDDEKNIFIQKIKAVINLVMQNIEIIQNSILKKSKLDLSICINFDSVIKDIKNEIEHIDERLDLQKKSQDELDKEKQVINNDIVNLSKIKKLHASKKEFSEWFGFTDQINKLTNMKLLYTTNTLTTKSKEAFSDVVEKDYMKIFKKYCDYLKLPKVNISLGSKKGQPQRGKYVVEQDVKVTDIMSEGEQKAIALAEFATDLTIRKNFCTTLFDDPVTSFDYKRAEKIAQIIYEISNDRQVLIFTHNIMFYYYLFNLSKSDNDKDNMGNMFFKVDEYDRDNKGLISLSLEERLETLKAVTSKIRSHAQKIDSKSCIGDVQKKELKLAYSEIRTWCELLVEEGFFQKIIRRYEPNIHFTNVSKINKQFIDDIPAVEALFNRCCRFMEGHSQPTEVQNIEPTLEEFRDDLKLINQLYDKYKS